MAERLWSSPPPEACARGAVRRRMDRALEVLVRREHNLTAAPGAALEAVDDKFIFSDESRYASAGVSYGKAVQGSLTLA